jgi:hypothetical protein
MCKFCSQLQGDRENAKVLVKEIIRSRKQVERMHISKAQLNSVSMQLRQNLGLLLSFYLSLCLLVSFFLSFFLSILLSSCELCVKV